MENKLYKEIDKLKKEKKALIDFLESLVDRYKNIPDSWLCKNAKKLIVTYKGK